MDNNLFKFLAKNQLASVTAVNHYYLAKYINSKYGKIVLFLWRNK